MKFLQKSCEFSRKTYLSYFCAIHKKVRKIFHAPFGFLVFKHWLVLLPFWVNLLPRVDFVFADIFNICIFLSCNIYVQFPFERFNFKHTYQTRDATFLRLVIQGLLCKVLLKNKGKYLCHDSPLTACPARECWTTWWKWVDFWNHPSFSPWTSPLQCDPFKDT